MRRSASDADRNAHPQDGAADDDHHQTGYHPKKAESTPAATACSMSTTMLARNTATAPAHS